MSTFLNPEHIYSCSSPALAHRHPLAAARRDDKDDFASSLSAAACSPVTHPADILQNSLA